MRDTTSQEDAVLAKRNQAIYCKVEIDSDGVGTFQDLGELQGRNWIKSADLSENVDSPVMTARVSLFREVYELSLATLKSVSKFNQPTPMIDIGREIKISTATMPRDTIPKATDFELMFNGYVDDLDWGGSDSNITIQCRDLGGVIQDTFIEVQREEGLVGGHPIEDVIQDILDNNGLSAITLTTIGTPTFSILPYLQRKESVLESIRKLAQMIGWDVRYRWSNTFSDFRLTLFEPTRTAPSVDHTFGPDRYDDVTSIKISRQRIRNVVQVVYGVIGARATVSAQDVASIAKYGRRFMEITESSSSEIDTGTEAQRMADAALSDLAEPDVDQSVAMDMFFPVQLGDFYRFSANDIHYDSDQDLAVVSYQHQLTESGAKTTLMTRGKPSAGVKRWLAIEGRAGVSPNADFEPPSVPVTVNAGSEKGAIIITYAKPTAADWDTTKAYVFGPAEILNIDTVARAANVATVATRTDHGMANGATVDVDAADNTFDNASATVTVTGARSFTYANAGANSGTAADTGTVITNDFVVDNAVNLVVEGRSDRFEIFGLQPGRRHLIKLVAFDTKGNASTIGVLSAIATLFTSPLHVNPDYDKDNAIYNGEFQIWTPPFRTQATTPPDIWKTIEEQPVSLAIIDSPDIWGTGLSGSGKFATFDTGTVLGGESSIRIRAARQDLAEPAPGTGIYGMATDEFLPVGGGKVYRATMATNSTSSAAISGLSLRFFDATKTTVVQTQILINPTLVASAWEVFPFNFKTAAAARFVQPLIAKIFSNTESTTTADEFTYWDRVELKNDLPKFHADTFFGGGVGTTVFPPAVVAIVKYFNIVLLGGTSYSIPLSAVTIDESGTYGIHGQVKVIGPIVPATTFDVFILVNGAPLHREKVNVPAGSADITLSVTTTSSSLLIGDVVQIAVGHSGAGAFSNIETETDLNFFTVAKLS